MVATSSSFCCAAEWSLVLRWAAWRADGEGWKADVAARERSQRVDESAIVKEMEMRDECIWCQSFTFERR